MLANDQHLALFLRITARVNEETLDMKIANAFRIGPDGRWKDSWFLSDDQTAMDGAGFRILVPAFLGGRSPGPRRG